MDIKKIDPKLAVMRMMSDEKVLKEYFNQIERPSDAFSMLHREFYDAVDRFEELGREMQNNPGDPELALQGIKEMALWGYIYNQHQKMGKSLAGMEPDYVELALALDKNIDEFIERAESKTQPEGLS